MRRRAEVAHQLSHTPQVDSIFNVPAGKDNLCAGLYVDNGCSDVNSVSSFVSGRAERLYALTAVTLPEGIGASVREL